MSAERAAGFSAVVDTVAAELAVVLDGFERLTAEEWCSPTHLVPVDPHLPPWTLLELAGHLDISIGITRTVISDTVDEGARPDRDAVGFFVFPSTDVASDFYDYAYIMVEGTSPSAMPVVLRDTFAQTLGEVRGTEPSTVGVFSGFEPSPLIRLDEFVSSRIVEAVVHGIDLTDALGRPSTATPRGVAHTAQLLDDLLQRSRDGGRPADLGDDLAWIRAASGRAPHLDPRLPLLC
jgi:Mycothiol maleylpyruvate isomerase N-terminal domain